MEKFDYRIGSLPEGWEDLSEYSFHGPTIEGFEHRLVLTIDRRLHPDWQTLKGYAAFKTDAYLNPSVAKNI